MNHKNVRAIVLKRIDYGEADRILTLLTDSLGQISAIAKGSRKINSKLAAGIEPLAVNQISLIAGKSDMHTVTSARSDTNFRHLLEDYETTQAAFFVMKLASKIHLSEAEPWLFETVVTSLKSLDDGMDRQITKLWSILTMLQQLGHFPDLEQADDGSALSESKSYRLDYTHGTLSVGGPLASQHIKLWRLCEKYQPHQLDKVNGARAAASESLLSAEQAINYTLN